jgi:hypothetical protein
MSKWFTANKLALNLDRINIIKFIINTAQYTSSTGYDEEVHRRVSNYSMVTT